LGLFLCSEYPKVLRVCVSTANLIEVDYEAKTNGLWFQDFPLKSSATSVPSTPLGDDFCSTLGRYLREFKVNTSFLQKYDFSNVKVVLISSIPGLFLQTYTCF